MKELEGLKIPKKLCLNYSVWFIPQGNNDSSRKNLQRTSFIKSFGTFSTNLILLYKTKRIFRECSKFLAGVPAPWRRGGREHVPVGAPREAGGRRPALRLRRRHRPLLRQESIIQNFLSCLDWQSIFKPKRAATHKFCLSLWMGHGIDRSDPSTHVDRSEILTRP